MNLPLTLEPDQHQSLGQLIADEPDAADALFSGIRVERRQKHTVVNDEWVERPFIATLINGRIVSDLPELGAWE